MQSNHKRYDHVSSYERIGEILNQSDLNYEEVDQLPSRERLTFINGFYAYCSALFIDMRDSSALPHRHKRPTLAKLYRAYISEVVAVMNGDPYCREITITGDGAWCVVNTPKKSDIDDVFSTSAKLSSMIQMFNYRLKKKGYEPIQVGIGMDYGRALMVKAGLSGSGISEPVYMGDVVNVAAKLASYGNQSWGDPTIAVGSVFYGNLNDHNKSLLSYNYNRGCYQGNVVNSVMEQWYKENCT